MDALSEPLQHFFCGKTMRDLFDGAVVRNIMLAPVNDSREIAESEQLAARGFFADVHDAGRGIDLRMPARFARIPGVDTDLRGPAPRIGEHNREVYAGIGIDGSELAALAAEGIA